MSEVIPWHSDLDRDIGMFLAENRDIPFSERLTGVYVCILRANLDAKTLLHYAACMFIARDMMLVDAQNFPNVLFSTMKQTKEVSDHIAKEQKSKAGRAAADALHSKPGNSRDKQEAIRTAWASGKYSSRDICAEEESRAIGMSFSTARKALRGTPKPA